MGIRDGESFNAPTWNFEPVSPLACLRHAVLVMISTVCPSTVQLIQA
jgi:hypothetical protein